MDAPLHPALTIVSKDKASSLLNGDGGKPRMTMSLFEYAKLLSYRAEALTHGAEPTIDMNEEGSGLTSAISIARVELELNKCPLVIVRRFPSGRTELVDPKNLSYSLI